MGASVLMVAWVALSSVGAPIPQKVVARQNEFFRQFWGTDFEWKFDKLPSEGTVPEFRVPYSGYIYPDKSGGTASTLRKYDMAFNTGRLRATSHELGDTTAIKKPTERRAGLFGLRVRTVMETPNWHGHCNGWAAASIRHAEPQESVRRNGVLFTPADIKALLAEIYMYNDYEHLAGLHEHLNAGTFHAIVANWVGRGAHPMGMEADPGEEKWNYPFYGYSSSSAKRSERRVEVKLNLAYAKDSNGEYQQSPRIQRIKYFHYLLDLNENGEITGGTFLNDGNLIDMVWVPLRPKRSGQKGNEPGNPYIDVDEVLSIWRESVPADVRSKWLVFDPPTADRVLETAGVESLIPVQDFSAVASNRPASIESRRESPAAETNATSPALMGEAADE